MIELKHVTKMYGDFTAVKDLSLTVVPGEVCVIIGPSGCGKSTMLKMVNRMLEPTRGTILVNGKNVRDFKAEVLRRQIGYVIQFVGLFPHMTVSDNIGVVPKLLSWDKNDIEKRVDELLVLTGLKPEDYRRKYPRELSGGEAQRIGVARALAADPPILLMDEPFGAVDPLNREVLQAEFIKIQKKLKKTVVFVTHDLDEAVRIADRIALLRDGTVVQYDTPENILAHPKSKFVHDFVGADRALKRLSRFTVGSTMRSAGSVKVSDDLRQVSNILRGSSSLRFLWVLNEEQKLMGWIETQDVMRGSTIEDAITRVNAERFAVREDSTLREALSRMLGEGVKVVPVVNSDLEVIGEITLQDIEKVTEEVQSEWKE
jgi:osmoprotectant transport system ATP-binding protein